MRAQHINITIPVSLKTRIDEESKRERIGRSTLIQKAVRFYLEIMKKKRLESLLSEGYLEMTGESLKIAGEFQELDNEALKHAN